MTASRHTALCAALLAFATLAPVPACAQGELERLGGGPGGVPQGNPRLGGFFNERAGTKPRPTLEPGAAAEKPVDADDSDSETPSIEFHAGLLSVEAEGVPVSDFFLEFNRQTGIPVRLAPGLTQRITGKVRGLRLERALALLLPPGTWQLIRRPNTALRADNAVLGLVVHPPGVPGVPVASLARPRVGGTNFGPAFEIPGEPTGTAAPAPAAFPVEEEDGSAPAPAPNRTAVGVTTAVVNTASALPGKPAADADAVRRRIADLVEQRLKKK